MKIRSVWLTKWVARAVVAISRLLFSTCRKELVIYPGTNGWDADVRGRFLYALWHDVLLFPLFMAQPHNMSALTSRHRDGAYVAEILRLLRIQPYRGSTARGGVHAVRQLLDTAERTHITLTPDGPRGPRRQLKDGIVFLASRTGQAIVPAAFSCRRGIRFQGPWTDMLLPLPFTTTYGILGRPIHIPPELTRDEISAQTHRIQEAMDWLYARVEDWATGRIDRPEMERATIPHEAAG